MVGDKRQGREKPAKIEQRKVKGPRTGVRTSGRTAACLSPICMGQAPRKKNTYKHIKREALSLSPTPHHPARWRAPPLSPLLRGWILLLSSK